MSLRGHYQNGYVTHDLDRAMAMAGPVFGLGSFTAFDVDMVLRMPSGEKASRLRVATAWAGSVQVELIQPISGHIAPYLDALPADPGDATPRLHHIAVRRDDLTAMREEALGLGLPLAFESGGMGINCVFLDARERVGHFFEFVSATSEGWQMLGWPDGYVAR